MNDQINLQKALNLRVIYEALVRFSCTKNLPHRLVEHLELQAFCFAFNAIVEQLLVRSHSTVSLMSSNSFLNYKQAGGQTIAVHCTVEYPIHHRHVDFTKSLGLLVNHYTVRQ